MAASYSLDLRKRVVAAVRGGLSRRKAAEYFDVSVASAIRWVRRESETGSPTALPAGGRRPFSLEAERAWIAQRMAAAPDLTLRALLAELRLRGNAVSYYAVWNIVHREGLSFKKKPARQRAGAA